MFRCSLPVSVVVYGTGSI